jgi:hypothetical protein
LASKASPDVLSHGWRRWLVPSLSDCLFLALMAWLIAFTIGSDEIGLLQDSQAGAQIRIGDWILDHGAAPSTDVFSFSRAGQPWFAWEWLTGVVFALVHRWLGLQGMVLLGAAVIATANLILLRHMLWRGANFLVVIFTMHLVVGASSLHYFARPHIFTLLFMAGAFFLLDRDQRKPDWRVWLLIPLTVLWANMHGAFVAMIASVAIVAVGRALEGAWAASRRYGLLAAACLVASLLNPYGYREHVHIAQYMSQGWLMELVQEFQPPQFHSAASHYLELLLAAGVALAVLSFARKHFATGLLLLAWMHMALTSVRHVPIFALVVTPLLAGELTQWWDRWTAGAGLRSVLALFRSLAEEYTPHLGRSSIWASGAIVLLAFAPLSIPWPRDFPEPRYPASLVSRHAEAIQASRIFTTDSWADYLTYRFHPRQRIFVDGRSDFFGKEMLDHYLTILRGYHGWDSLMESYRFDAALVPSQSAIASLLRRDARWKIAEDDGRAVLFKR